jgi:hypothetical protein
MSEHNQQAQAKVVFPDFLFPIKAIAFICIFLLKLVFHVLTTPLLWSKEVFLLCLHELA